MNFVSVFVAANVEARVIPVELALRSDVFVTIKEDEEDDDDREEDDEDDDDDVRGLQPDGRIGR